MSPLGDREVHDSPPIEFDQHFHLLAVVRQLTPVVSRLSGVLVNDELVAVLVCRHCTDKAVRGPVDLDPNANRRRQAERPSRRRSRPWPHGIRPSCRRAQRPGGRRGRMHPDRSCGGLGTAECPNNKAGSLSRMGATRRVVDEVSPCCPDRLSQPWRKARSLSCHGADPSH